MRNQVLGIQSIEEMREKTTLDENVIFIIHLLQEWKNIYRYFITEGYGESANQK